MSMIVNKPHIQGSMKEIGNSLKYLSISVLFCDGQLFNHSEFQ